jgi:hypothetical protein
MEGLLLMALLLCPIAMGAMMFLMIRGRRSHGATHERAQEEEAPVIEPKAAGHRES